jgi:hypothetical protein
MPDEIDLERMLTHAFDRMRPWAAICVGSVLIAAGAAAAFSFVRWTSDAPIAGRATLVLAVTTLAYGLVITARVRRRLAPSANVVMARDTRPPIIYLRTFVADDAIGEELRLGPLAFDTSILGPVRDLLPLPLTLEQRLAASLRGLGPCIAVGDPGEELPRLGFNRLYLGGDEWQASVESLMKRARLVIIRASRLTPSLQWELATAIALVRPERLLVLLPYSFSGKFTKTASLFGDAHDYDAFRAMTQSVFPKGLPDWDRRGMFLRFDDDWNAHMVVAERTLRKTLRMAVRNVVEAEAIAIDGLTG